MSRINYNHKKIEKKWQAVWEKKALYKTPKGVSKENKFYILPQLPYPSGEGLHMGHAEGYTACDIYARYQRMNGKKVLQVIGWDAFGLPAENFAIKNNVHPRINTDKAINNFRKQIRSLGISVDWSREVGSHKPDYYKWTQWFFLLMYKRGLAYRKKQRVNWCDSCKTVLANEQVVEQECERCGHKIEQKQMDQWFLKITEYADRLYDDLDRVDWPKETVKRQREWIGRKEGATVQFKIQNSKFKIETFTTRLDTIFGVTFITISLELAKKWIDAGWKASEEVVNYVSKALFKSDQDRLVGAGEKTGVFANIYAINPVNNEKIPVYVADYVLADVGTGAVMGVPAHDRRDFEFATKYKLPIKKVVNKVDINEYKSYLMGADKITDEDLKKLRIKIVKKTDEGNRCLLIPIDKAKEYEKLIEIKMNNGYWNEYIGDQVIFIFKHKNGQIERLILHEGNDKQIAQIAEEFTNGEIDKDAPLWKMLYENDFYKDVAFHNEDGVLIHSDRFSGMQSNKARKKILDTAEKENWGKKKTTYHLRDWSVSRQRFWGAPIPMVYDEKNKLHPVKEEDLPVILPDDVDFKPTGQSPLTYSDLFQKGVEEKYGKGWRREVDTLDTFMCSSWYYYRYLDPHNDKAFASPESLKKWMPVDFYLGGVEHVNGHLLYSRFFTKVLYDAGYIDFDEPFSVHRHQGTILGEDNRKMSKRWGNVINPTDVVKSYGADTARIYEMFMGPLEQDKMWNDNAVAGIRRFLIRIFSLVKDEKKSQADKSSKDLEKLLHKTIQFITHDTKQLKFNTAIARFMEFTNLWMRKGDRLSKEDTKLFLKLLAPYAPHMTEELWHELGEKDSIHIQDWPEHDILLIKENMVTIVVQVNGKVRTAFKLKAQSSNDKDEIIEQAKQIDRVKKYLEGKEIKKEIFVPGKLINFVV